MSVGEGGVAVDAEQCERAAERYLVLSYGDAHACAQEALAYRGEFRSLDRVTPFRNHDSVLHHHDGDRVDLLRPVVRLLQAPPPTSPLGRA